MSKPNFDLTLDRAREVFTYDPDTGGLWWKVSTGARVRAGDSAGHVSSKGYRRVEVDGKSYGVHRVAWLLYYGAYPVEQIDHRDGDKANNRITNLREATNAVNCQNQLKLRSNNTSGYAGVVYHRNTRKWLAQLQVDGKQCVVGRFDRKEDAVQCRRNAERRYYSHRFG